MRAVIQRVSGARVEADGDTVGEIGSGLLVLVGVSRDDSDAEASYLAEKTANLRIFEDEQGKMNRSVLEVGGEVLAVSQFTLYGDVSKGRRPSFVTAAPSEQAEPLFDQYVTQLGQLGVQTATGRFGAKMQVHLANDGPVTLLLER